MQRPAGFQPVHAFHIDVQQYHIGFDLLQELEGFFPVIGGACAFQISGLREGELQPVYHQLMVIYD
jgi:hypothetical protein